MNQQPLFTSVHTAHRTQSMFSRWVEVMADFPPCQRCGMGLEYRARVMGPDTLWCFNCWSDYLESEALDA